MLHWVLNVSVHMSVRLLSLETNLFKTQFNQDLNNLYIFNKRNV